MSNIVVQLTKTPTPLPSGSVFGHTNLVVTDADGAIQNFALNGSETPPWSVIVVGVADGTGIVAATDVDASGATLGTPVTQTFTSTSPSFSATTGIAVSPA